MVLYLSHIRRKEAFMRLIPLIIPRFEPRAPPLGTECSIVASCMYGRYGCSMVVYPGWYRVVYIPRVVYLPYPPGRHIPPG